MLRTPSEVVRVSTAVELDADADAGKAASLPESDRVLLQLKFAAAAFDNGPRPSLCVGKILLPERPAEISFLVRTEEIDAEAPKALSGPQTIAQMPATRTQIRLNACMRPPVPEMFALTH
jgi:hypothetical protein